MVSHPSQGGAPGSCVAISPRMTEGSLVLASHLPELLMLMRSGPEFKWPGFAPRLSRCGSASCRVSGPSSTELGVDLLFGSFWLNVVVVKKSFF